MSSPFRYFRKHTKAFMAVAAVLAIFIFVVGDALQGSGGSPGGRDAGATVATWNGGSLNEAELQTLVQHRRMVDGFLKGIFSAGGGRSVFDLPPASSVPFLLITDDRPEAIEADVVGIEVFSDLADEAGITVSDRMINDYIEEMGLKKVTEEQVRQVLGSMGDRNVDQNVAIVFSMLRKMLQAQFYQMTFGDASRVVLPQQRWDDWRKVNERISVQAAVLPVEKFIAKVPEPSEDQLLGFYNDHKDEPTVQHVAVGGREMPAPTVGFTEPRRVRLHYLLGSITERSQKLMESVTEEEIADYYERNKRLDFLKFDLDDEAPVEPPADGPEGAAAADQGASEPAAPEEPADDVETPEEAAEAPAEVEAPTTEPGEPSEAMPPDSATTEDSSVDEPATAEPATEEPATEEPATEEPAADEPATEEAAAEEPAADEPVTEEPAPAEPANGEQNSFLDKADSPFRLVAFQQDPPSNDESDAASADAQSTEDGDSSQNADSPAADSAPAAEASTTEAADSTAETTATDEPSSTDAPASSADAESTTGASETAGAEDATAETEQYEPLEKVRDDIRQRIATDKAVEELQGVAGEAAAQLQAEYNRYARRLFEAREAKKKAPAVPAKLKDLTWLAERYGLKLEKTTPLTAREMLDTIVGRATDTSQRQNVTQAAFTTLERFEPFLAKELEGDWYVVAKIEDAAARTPEFKEVRDRVVEAWKRQEAAKLAEAEAKKLADEVEKSTAPFDQFFFADRGYEVIKQTEFFSWLRYPAGRMGEGRLPELSDVPELTNVGPEFMEAAFSLDGNDAKGVLNFDHSAAYVIRLNRRERTEQELQQLFLTEEPSWPGRQDMFDARVSAFRQSFQQRLLDERAGFEYDEEYLERRRESLQQ